MTEIQSQKIQDIEGEIMCLQALYPQNDLDTNQDDILALKASADPDTMYLHEAFKEPDIGKFIKAMTKEVEYQMNSGNFTIIHKKDIPQYATVLPAVWQIKRKRDILTRAVKKWKARLNVDGSCMKKGNSL